MTINSTTRAEIAHLIRSQPISFDTEAELQEGIGRLLSENAINYQREHRLSSSDRIDFLLNDGLGIEVKIKGSFADILRQLNRYAQFDAIASLILVTTQARHLGMPAVLNRKPVTTCFISFARGL